MAATRQLKALAIATLCVVWWLSTPRTHAQTREAEFDAYLAKAAQAQAAGDVPNAIAAYQGALAIRPAAAELWSNLGLMQHQSRDTAGALASFTNAHRLQPKLFVPALFLGLENLDLGKPKEAVAYLEQARQLKPDDPTVSLYLGRAHFASKEFESAASAYTRAAQLNPKSGDAWYRLGLSCFEVAESDSSSLASLNRQSPFFHALEADSLSSQDKLDRAAKIYAQVLESPERPPCMRSALAFVLLRQNKPADAGTLFQQDLHAGGCLIAQLGTLRIAFETHGADLNLAPLASLWAIDPGFLETYLAQLTAGLTPERFSLLDQAFDRTTFTNLTPDDVSHIKAALHGVATLPASSAPARVPARTPHPQQAQADSSRGAYQACADHLSPAINTLTRDNLSLLASCSLFTGDFNSALAAAAKLRNLRGAEDEGLYWSIRANQSLGVRSLVRAAQAEPDSIRLHELLAETYRDMGQYAAAEAEFATALTIDPTSFSALLGAAANNLQQYKLDPASDMIHRALEQKPSDPEANYIAGEILIDQHQLDAAEPHLQIGLAAKAELVPRVHALLGRVYAGQGKEQQAIDELKLALASDDDGSVHFQLGRLYQKTGQQKLAEAAFEETRRIQARQ